MSEGFLSPLSEDFEPPTKYRRPSTQNMVNYLNGLCFSRYGTLNILSYESQIAFAKRILRKHNNDFKGLMRAICHASEISEYPFTFKFVGKVYEEIIRASIGDAEENNVSHSNHNRVNTGREGQDKEQQQLTLPLG